MIEDLFARRYVLERQIGRGRGGQVFAALDRQTGARVAVKLLLDPPEDVAGVEGAALRSVQHPNLVRVLDAGWEGAQAYVAHELVDGGSLDTLDKPLPAPKLTALATQLLEALSFLHGQGILHGDVKPENVFIRSGDPGHFKLGDFGLARRSVDVASGVTRGSPAFMPPEVVRGEPDDERSDLYALGVTLYECTFGELPFRSDDVRELLYQHLTETPPRLRNPGDADPRIVKLLHELLQKDPARRPSSALTALALLGGETAAVPRWVPPSLGVLVGRDAEFGRLEAALAGDEAAASLDGAPGIGKTRLMREFAVRTELRGTPAVWWEATGLRGLAPPADAAHVGAPTDARALAEARAREVRELLGDAPWLLLVDDLDRAPHWFLDSIAFFIRDVAGEPQPGRMICVAARGRARSLVHEAVGAVGLPDQPALELRPWDDHRLFEAATALLGVSHLDTSLVHLLRGATGGIPSEVEQVCRRLVQDRLLRVDMRGRLTLTAEVSADDVVESRGGRAEATLERCTKQEFELLCHAAVLVAAARRAFLHRLLGEQVSEALEGLRRDGLLATSRLMGGLVYGPAHEGVRQATLRRLGVPGRRALHDRIAAVLERHAGLAPEEFAALHRTRGSSRQAGWRAVQALERTHAATRPELLREAYESLLEIWPQDEDPMTRVQVEVSLLRTLHR
ncbi:MAG: protein kinase, partial [Candidatus Krumholzibacteriia bacterium]